MDNKQGTSILLNDKENTFFKVLFIIAALWNLTGGILGYFNTAHSFNVLFDRQLTDPLFSSIYQGACGTTLLYFIGYMLVAYNPVKHTGVVIVGGIGKVGFAIQLLQFYLAGIANSTALIVIVGDFIFSLLFLYYFYRLFKANIKIR